MKKTILLMALMLVSVSVIAVSDNSTTKEQREEFIELSKQWDEYVAKMLIAADSANKIGEDVNRMLEDVCKLYEKRKIKEGDILNNKAEELELLENNYKSQWRYYEEKWKELEIKMKLICLPCWTMPQKELER